MFMRRRLACSFCGKDAADVAKLVAGPKVYICDQCVTVASRIMEGGDPHEPTPQPVRRGFLQRLRARICSSLQPGRARYSSHAAGTKRQREASRQEGLA
jgi:ATP-dependent Clp protease ATP-binding subunit ClpX